MHCKNGFYDILGYSFFLMFNRKILFAMICRKNISFSFMACGWISNWIPLVFFWGKENGNTMRLCYKVSLWKKRMVQFYVFSCLPNMPILKSFSMLHNTNIYFGMWNMMNFLMHISGISLKAYFKHQLCINNFNVALFKRTLFSSILVHNEFHYQGF